MWPVEVPWMSLRFGVEIEFVGGCPGRLAFLPGWRLQPDERQTDEDGTETGGELAPDPLLWSQRAQIAEMLRRLRRTGARANWACGLHVHVGLEPWGEDVVLPLVDAALRCQAALGELLRSAPDRALFVPPVTETMRAAHAAGGGADALTRHGRPQSHRCGINARSWYDTGTVEIRLANGSTDYAEVRRTVELCLRFVAAVGAGRGADLPQTGAALAAALGAPAQGYPPPRVAPLWHRERLWLEDALLPVLGPPALAAVPGEVHHVRPSAGGLIVVVEREDGTQESILMGWTGGAWRPV